MAKFNKKTEAPTVINYMGERAVKLPPETELAGLLLTSFFGMSYYETEAKLVGRLKELIFTCDKLFVAKAAVYARTVFGMRSITHAVASELAKYIGGQPWAKDFYNAVVKRPDDMLEIMAYHLANNGKETNAMRKGFALAFGKFDSYQLAKYRGENRDLKLVDVANIVHPRPTQKNAEALTSLMKGTLKSTDTWEAQLTKAGQDADDEQEKMELKGAAWKQLIESKKIGYFALLRNLRNIIEQAPQSVDAACELLTNKHLIEKSLVLPFRYLTAYKEIEAMPVGKKVFEKDGVVATKVLKAIERAIELSIANLPVLTGKTIILSDNSGSMRGDSGGHSLVSAMSNTTTASIANLFAVMYWLKADNTLVGVFGDRLIHPTLVRSWGLFDNYKIIDSAGKDCGPSTEAGIFTMLKRLIKDKIMCDTIVVFSDCQIGSGCRWYGDGNKGDDFMQLFAQYRKINPNFRCYSVDLKGYGTTVFDGKVIKISGWSEKIFQIMKYAESDPNALVNEIKKTQL